jgi:hypothetical protein
MLDRIEEPTNKYPASDYGIACTLRHPESAGRSANCRRQAITTDVISIGARVSDNLFRDAAQQSMGRYMHAFNSAANWDMGGYFNSGTWVMGATFNSASFGRNCEWSRDPENCYQNGTIARAFNHWFSTVSYRNVDIDTAYSFSAPVWDIDPQNLFSANSNKLLMTQFLPTPGGMFEGHLTAIQFNLGYTPTQYVGDNINTGFAQGGIFDSNGSAGGVIFPWLHPTTIQSDLRRKDGSTISITINDAGERLATYDGLNAPPGPGAGDANPAVVLEGTWNYDPTGAGVCSSKLIQRRLYTLEDLTDTALVQIKDLSDPILSFFDDGSGYISGSFFSSGAFFTSGESACMSATVMKRLYNGVRAPWEGGDFITSWKLGDTQKAEPVVVGKPDRKVTANGGLFIGYATRGLAAYNNYRQGVTLDKLRPRIVLLPDNEGFLHSFHAGTYNEVATTPPETRKGYYLNGTGDELWAFMPHALLKVPAKNITGWDRGSAFGSWGAGKMMSSTVPGRFYGLDAAPLVADVWIDGNADGDEDCPVNFASYDDCEWKTLVIGGLGRGGQAYYAINVTDTLNPRYFKSDFIYASPDNDTSSDSLGLTTSQPTLLRMKACQSDPTCSNARTGDPATESTRPVDLFAIGLGYHPTGDPRWEQCPVNYSDRDLPCYDNSGAGKLGRGMAVINVANLNKAVEFKYDAGAPGDERQLRFAVPGQVAAIDIDGDGFTDRLYFGDLGGQLYRVDISGLIGANGPANGALNLVKCGGGVTAFCVDFKRMFAFSDGQNIYGADVEWQSIWTRPALVNLNLTTTYVGFGTGDRTALLSDHSSRSGYFVSILDSDYAALLEISDLTNRTGNDTQGVSPTNPGWYLHFPEAGMSSWGERIIYDPVGYGNLFVFTTSWPDDDASASTALNPDSPGFLTRQQTMASSMYMVEARSGGAPASKMFTNCGGAVSRRFCQTFPGMLTGVQVKTMTIEDQITPIPPGWTARKGEVVSMMYFGDHQSRLYVPPLATDGAVLPKQPGWKEIRITRQLYFREVTP